MAGIGEIQPLSVGGIAAEIAAECARQSAAAAARIAVSQALTPEELLDYRGADFVRLCFLAILRREATDAEFRHWLDRLHQGEVSRSGMIVRLRFSAEGRRRRARLIGLRRLLGAHVADRVAARRR